jgi:hypothetical protein
MQASKPRPLQTGTGKAWPPRRNLYASSTAVAVVFDFPLRPETGMPIREVVLFSPCCQHMVKSDGGGSMMKSESVSAEILDGCRPHRCILMAAAYGQAGARLKSSRMRLRP